MSKGTSSSRSPKRCSDFRTKPMKSVKNVDSDVETGKVEEGDERGLRNKATVCPTSALRLDVTARLSICVARRMPKSGPQATGAPPCARSVRSGLLSLPRAHFLRAQMGSKADFQAFFVSHTLC